MEALGLDRYIIRYIINLLEFLNVSVSETQDTDGRFRDVQL